MMVRVPPSHDTPISLPRPELAAQLPGEHPILPHPLRQANHLLHFLSRRTNLNSCRVERRAAVDVVCYAVFKSTDLIVTEQLGLVQRVESCLQQLQLGFRHTAHGRRDLSHLLCLSALLVELSLHLVSLAI